MTQGKIAMTATFDKALVVYPSILLSLGQSIHHNNSLFIENFCAINLSIMTFILFLT